MLTIAGKKIFTDYQNNNNVLCQENRDKLIKDIVQSFIDSNRFMHTPDFLDITAQICSIFCTERNVSIKSVFRKFHNP